MNRKTDRSKTQRAERARDVNKEIEELCDVNTALAGLVSEEALKLRVLNAQGHTNWCHHGDACRLRDGLLEVLLPHCMTGEEAAQLGGEDACRVRLLKKAGTS